jgi:hypothetical protein
MNDYEEDLSLHDRACDIADLLNEKFLEAQGFFSFEAVGDCVAILDQNGCLLALADIGDEEEEAIRWLEKQAEELLLEEESSHGGRERTSRDYN